MIERLKPRLRIYRDVHDFNIKSLFLEFKHKSNRTIYKQRCEINQKEADNLLLGQAPVPTEGISYNQPLNCSIVFQKVFTSAQGGS